MRMPIKQQDYKGMGVGGRPGEEAGCNAQNNGFGAFWECPKRPRSGKWIFRDAEPILSEKFLLRGNSLQPERNHPIWQF